MELTQIKFLLDENIPLKLKSTFTKKGLDCTSVRELGWSGFKDKEISKQIGGKKVVLITRDRDFTFIWQKQNLRIIYLAIEPAILNTIQPRVQELLNNWKYDPSFPFLLILQKDAMRFWQ